MHGRTEHPRSRGRAVRIVAALVCAAVVAALAQLVAVAASAAAAAPVVVSLTYDDGVADVAQAGALMAARGLRGTFYVNSGPIGSSGYMTRADLSALAAAGHEIGGHTVTHANLVTLSDAELHRQVCTDRSTLLGWGFPAVSFAYPYSSLDAAVRQAVVDCGYNSARQVGDIVSPGACQGCDVAETIPPVDPFYTRAPDSVMSTWTVADMIGLVTQAQAAGRGG